MFSADVWNNLAGGFWCQNSKATVADEVPLSSVLTDELHDNEDKWSDEELTKCFEQEACRIKGSLQNVDFEDMATALSTRWLKRLEKDEDKKRKGRHARAFLRSHALDILLSCLTKTEVGRTAIFVAAGLDPDRESIESAAISPAVPLRLLLSKTSDVPKVLMDSLLNLLSSVGKPGSEATPTDMQWVLLLLSAAVMDASEVPVRMAIRNIQVIGAQIQQITDGWKEMVQKFDDAPECPLKVGDAVWAEWPRTGRWFRGEIIELLDDYAMIQWLQRPTNVKGGHEDHYLISAVGEYFNFDQPTEVLKVAVLPALFSRPQPIPEQEEEGWSQFVDAAENLTTKYHQLGALFEDLGKNDKSELKKMSEFEKKKSEEAIKTLHGTTKSIIGVKKDFTSRAKAPGAASALVSNFLNEVVDIASDLEAELAKRLENATAMDGAHERLLGMRDKVAKCCLDAERLRGRYMEELFNGLHSSIYGEDAAFLVQDFNTTQSVKNTITNAIKLADQCWKEAVQFAAETIDGPMAVGCEEVSRAATRYKEMRPELKKIQERLAQVERSAPEIPPGRKRKVIKKGSSLGSQIAMETKGYLRTQSELLQAQEEAAAPAEWAPDFPEVDFNSQAATAAFTAKEVQHVQRPATIPEQSSTVDADDQASLGQQPVKDSPPGAPQETETETKAAVDPEPGSKAIPAPATIAISSKAEVELAKPASKEVACCMQGLGRFQERCCGMHS